MLKRILIILVALLLLLSFSSVALAGQPDFAAEKGARLERDADTGKLLEVWLPNDVAAKAAGNPIDVAGK